MCCRMAWRLPSAEAVKMSTSGGCALAPAPRNSQLKATIRHRDRANEKGIQVPMLGGQVSGGNAFGGGLDIGPRFVEQDGVAACRHPDVSQAQLGGQRSISRRLPQFRRQVVEPVPGG